jgi:hypothetical protein
VREVVRSTLRLERTNHELRRTFRQVGCFSSPKGAEVAVYIQVTRLNAESGQDELDEVGGQRGTASCSDLPGKDTLPGSIRNAALLQPPLPKPCRLLS